MFNEVIYIHCIFGRKVWRRCLHIYYTEEKLFLFFSLKIALISAMEHAI